MARGDLTDHEWEQIAPLLPRSEGKRGGQYRDHRQVINGILWITRTGAPWEDLPERYGPKSTCHDRLKRWEREGVWERVLQALQRRADEAGELEWTLVCVDGTVVRAHQHAAGARHTPGRADRKDGAEKGGVVACLRGDRAQSRRVDDQVAPRLRRARSADGSVPDSGPTARKHAVRGRPGRHSRSSAPRPTAQAAGRDGLG
jgi:transposase